MPMVQDFRYLLRKFTAPLKKIPAYPQGRNGRNTYGVNCGCYYKTNMKKINDAWYISQFVVSKLLINLNKKSYEND
jgi:hypothetical protein